LWTVYSESFRDLSSCGVNTLADRVINGVKLSSTSLLTADSQYMTQERLEYYFPCDCYGGGTWLDLSLRKEMGSEAHLDILAVEKMK